MKTSTKILFTLLAVIIVGIFALNIILKNRLDKNLSKAIQQESVIQSERNDSTAVK